MSGAAVQAIDVNAVAGVGSADGPGQSVGSLRRDYQMHVIGHKAVAVDGHVEPVALLAKRVEIEAAIIVDEEDGLLVVAAMGDVVRRAGHLVDHPAIQHHQRRTRQLLAHVAVGAGIASHIHAIRIGKCQRLGDCRAAGTVLIENLLQKGQNGHRWS